MMKLYGTPPTRAIRAIWLINELGLECEIIPVDITAPDGPGQEFLALNPCGKVPVLVDGDVVITESAAIPLYLAEKCPEKGLIPTSLADRSQMYRWIFFLVTEIEQPLWRIARHTSDLYADADKSPADVKLAKRECKEMLAVLEQHMQGKERIAGSSLSVADFIAAYTLDWASEAKLLRDFPRLTEYRETMYRRPTAPMTIEEAFAGMQK